MTRAAAAGDIAIVAAVMVVPQVAGALLGTCVHTAVEPPPPHRTLAANSLVWATVAALAIYLTHRGGQPMSSIGLRWTNPVIAAASAVLATVTIYACLIVTVVGMAGLTGASPQTMAQPAREVYGMFGRPTWGMILGIAGSAGVFEEIVFRGFLLSRLRVLAGSWPVAIVIGSALFAAPHIWQGRWAVVLILPVGVVLAITFVRARGLAAPMLAHFLFNFLQLATINVLQDLPEWREILSPES